MFGLDIPECKPFKVAYEDCFKENVQSKLSSWVFDPAAAAQCEEPFLNYKVCVEEMMRRKVEAAKKK